MVERPVSRWDYREIIPVVKKGGGGGSEKGIYVWVSRFQTDMPTSQKR